LTVTDASSIQVRETLVVAERKRDLTTTEPLRRHGAVAPEHRRNCPVALEVPARER
jgi:hypothetical protein